MTGARSRRTAAGRPRPVLAARAGGGVSRGRGASRRIRRRATTASNQPPRNPWGWLLTAAHSGPLDDRSRNGPGNSAHYLLTGGPTENCFRRSKGIKVVSRPVRRKVSRRSPLTCGNGPISSLSSGKTLLSFVDVRYRSWPSCGPHVVPGLTPVARQAPGRPGKSTKSLKLSVTSGTRWRMQQAAIHLSFCWRGALVAGRRRPGCPSAGRLDSVRNRNPTSRVSAASGVGPASGSGFLKGRDHSAAQSVHAKTAGPSDSNPSPFPVVGASRGCNLSTCNDI